MRIAIIAGFNDLDVRGWSKAFAFGDKFESLGHSVTSFNIYKVDSVGNYLGYTDDQLRDFIARQHEFDFVLLLDCWDFISPLYAYINIPSIIETGNDPLSLQQNLSKTQYFDMICSPDKLCVQRYKEHGLNAYWFKPWVDMSCHYHDPKITRDKLAVSVTEGWGGEGISHFMRVQLGQDWFDHKPATRFELNSLLNRGQIVFCHSIYNNVINLMFEAASCRSMIMSNRLTKESGIDDIFTENNDIIYYNNWKDAVHKIQELRNDQDKIQSIAQNGFQNIVDNHTLLHRVKEILEIVRNIK